jgi:hypothetical protein
VVIGPAFFIFPPYCSIIYFPMDGVPASPHMKPGFSICLIRTENTDETVAVWDDRTVEYA